MIIQSAVNNTELIPILVSIFCDIYDYIPIAAIVLVHTITLNGSTKFLI